jgi:hypothetical protein
MFGRIFLIFLGVAFTKVRRARTAVSFLTCEVERQAHRGHGSRIAEVELTNVTRKFGRLFLPQKD